jgi:hypothetical protein
MPTTYANALNVLETLQLLDAEQLGYVDTILRGASLAKAIPIIPPSEFKMDEYYERKQKSESIIQTRLLNTNPDSKHINQYERITERTIQLGGSVEIDYKLLSFKPNELDRRITDFLYDLGFSLDYRIINGDPGNGEFVGIKQRIASDMLFSNGGAPIQINASAANMRTFMSMFRKAHRKVKAGPGATKIAIMNDGVNEAIQGGRDQLGANVIGYATLDILNETVMTLDGVPLVIVRDDDFGNAILPQTETLSNTDCASIYILCIGGLPGEGSDQIPNGIVALSEGGVQQTPFADGNIRRVTIDYEYGLRVPHRTAARVQGIRI